jgi:hypothetical protein
VWRGELLVSSPLLTEGYHIIQMQATKHQQSASAQPKTPDAGNQKPGHCPATHSCDASTHMPGRKVTLGLFLVGLVERILACQLMQAAKRALEALSAG